MVTVIPSQTETQVPDTALHSLSRFTFLPERSSTTSRVSQASPCPVQCVYFARLYPAIACWLATFNPDSWPRATAAVGKPGSAGAPCPAPLSCAGRDGFDSPPAATPGLQPASTDEQSSRHHTDTHPHLTMHKYPKTC
ncbi:hypothetical protein M8Z33_00470 [Streptomyces sp. ZAF1911]|uniref:hypothetical protein n=1 Tax=Streptomyces sp. ZAF1911 TaxID=2944129 RepID=UPI00237B5741|nr:hypothetical protein [Streptomyces sp. ZAF1911]MDD9375165.1 hypothetical protein [Streptomyces sp. ZAF1911]